MSANHLCIKCKDVKNIYGNPGGCRPFSVALVGTNLQCENGQQLPEFPYIFLKYLHFTHYWPAFNFFWGFLFHPSFGSSVVWGGFLPLTRNAETWQTWVSVYPYFKLSSLLFEMPLWILLLLTLGNFPSEPSQLSKRSLPPPLQPPSLCLYVSDRIARTNQWVLYLCREIPPMQCGPLGIR